MERGIVHRADERDSRPGTVQGLYPAVVPATSVGGPGVSSAGRAAASALRRGVR